MRNDLMLDLAECSEFRQTLRQRPARIIHGTAILLTVLIATALAWMALTKANLIVRVAGRVRPVTGLARELDRRGEEISCEVAGGVVEVNVDQGDAVRQGTVLLRLDTKRVENQIARLGRLIQAEEEELQKLQHLEDLAMQQFQSASQKAEAELAQAREELRLAQQQQAVAIRLAKLEVETAEDAHLRAKNLAASRAATAEDLFKAAIRVREANENLQKAQLPLDQGKVQVLLKALEMVRLEWEVKRNDLEINRRAKQGKLEADRLEMANLELERDRSVVRAPVEGIVTAVRVKVGDVLQPGKVGVTMARQRGFEFEANVASEDVALLRSGMPVRIKLDAYDYQRYGTLDGTLRFVSPDSELSDPAKGPQRVLYSAKVSIPCDQFGRGEHRGQVKLGMSGQAEIVTDNESLLMILLRRIRQAISLS